VQSVRDIIRQHPNLILAPLLDALEERITNAVAAAVSAALAPRNGRKIA
jgi:hypothetical protein